MGGRREHFVNKADGLRPRGIERFGQRRGIGQARLRA
jgi:hypothetical protein